MNVYYLPARQTDTSGLATASRWSVLRARWYRAWWRLRLTVAEVWGVVRRSSARPTLEDHVRFATPEPASRRRLLGPARIIDLELARRRRALAAAARA